MTAQRPNTALAEWADRHPDAAADLADALGRVTGRGPCCCRARRDLVARLESLEARLEPRSSEVFDEKTLQLMERVIANVNRRAREEEGW